MYEERYKMALYHTCRLSAAIEDIVRKKEAGFTYSSEYVKDILNEFSLAKQELLVEKKKAGYKDGLSFMEDAKFFGFGLHQGMIQGDYLQVPVVCRPWVDAKQTEENRFRFEVGILLYSHYMFRQGMFQEFKPLPYFQNKRNFALQKRLFLIHIRDGMLGILAKILMKKEVVNR